MLLTQRKRFWTCSFQLQALTPAMQTLRTQRSHCAWSCKAKSHSLFVQQHRYRQPVAAPIICFVKCINQQQHPGHGRACFSGC